MEIRGLTKKYPAFTLDKVSFNLPKGAIMGVIGENGAGKSTLFHAILGLIRSDGGEVSFWGGQLSGQPRPIKEDIGVVFDDICFYQTLTPRMVERISREAYQRWDTKLYYQYLERFDVAPDREIKSLSKGMKIKLCIAAALSHAPRLLILDEATSGLDPVIRDEILDLFLDFIQDEEHSILLSSHITSDLEKVADYITFLHNGRLVFCKPKDELIYRYGILRCSDADYRSIDRADIVASRRRDYEWDVLVSDRDAASRKYRGAVVDTSSIDEMMLLYIKGEQIQGFPARGI